ncbi:MAG: PEP-CTERM sorting domain-containing protein [Bdellovibrionota bacterium]
MKKNLLVAAAGMFCLAVGARNANAATFDFAAIATGNEHGAVSESFTNGGVTTTASGRNLANTTPYFMYLDEPAGGPGGLGVCKDLGAGECTPGNDDNYGLNEVLELTFDVPVEITEIEFSNGNHEDVYTGNMGIAVNSTPTSVADFGQYLTAAVFNLPLVGTKFSFISNSVISGIADDNTRVLYISKLTVTPTSVPEPATLGLLSIGALGGLFGRRKRA